MARKAKCKPRIIPPQDKRICGSICFCQLVVVFSSVSLIYLTVAVYIPAYKVFHSGFETTPIMCQTINTSMINNCSWASCGEWCLTKTSGFCPQIHVTTRQNGTNLYFTNCTAFTSVSCPQVYASNLPRINCNNGTECATLTGVYNCSLGHCTNLSQIYQCHYKADGFVIDSDKDNQKLNGFFDCKVSRCTKIKRIQGCDRYCTIINTTNINTFIDMDDILYTANCSTAYATTETNGNLPGKGIPPTEFWNRELNKVIMLTCHHIYYNNSIISGTDCINGTTLNSSLIPIKNMNFTTYWKIRNAASTLIDTTQKFLPMQTELTIFNHSRLYINYDGCVNTLRGECKDFLQTHGRDGKNQTAQSRFPCYYNKNNSFMVVARYDLDKTWQHLVIALSVPLVLFVISFFTLCVIMQSVKVGDDTKMRCKYCLGNTEPDNADIFSNNKYSPSANNIQNAIDTSVVMRT